MITNKGNVLTPKTVLIVGGGASGVLAAIRLLGSEDAKNGSLRVVLVERSAKLGRGAAYGTESSFHLLNVRQGGMSAYAEDPDHFARWIARHYPLEMKNQFQPRTRYGEYLNSLLSEVRREGVASAYLQVTSEAVGFSENPAGRVRISLSDGQLLEGDYLVVATGHHAVRIPSGLESLVSNPLFIADPWISANVDQIKKAESILIAGSGLTAVDVAFSLLRRGHAGKITILSRHGFSPASHVAFPSVYPLTTPFPDESLRGVFRELRREAKRAGESWPNLVDRFRAEVPRVWMNWSEGDRKRFLRHVRPHWEVARHRIAPEVFREWDLYRRGGRIRVVAGRVSSCTITAGAVHLGIKERRGTAIDAQFDRVINCTGMVPDLSFFQGHGFASDECGVGIPTDSCGRPFSKKGSVVSNIFVLGPALRSRFWEMTAIPDLRLQAKAVADAIHASVSKN